MRINGEMEEDEVEIRDGKERELEKKTPFWRRNWWVSDLLLRFLIWRRRLCCWRDESLSCSHYFIFLFSSEVVVSCVTLIGDLHILLPVF